MHIQTSNSKVSAAEKMHMTTKRKGNHEAKKTKQCRICHDQGS